MIDIFDNKSSISGLYNLLKTLNELVKLNFDQLVSTVCMISPFSIQEKQKLIEAVEMQDKIKILETHHIMDMKKNLVVHIKEIYYNCSRIFFYR